MTGVHYLELINLYLCESASNISNFITYFDLGLRPLILAENPGNIRLEKNQQLIYMQRHLLAIRISCMIVF